MIFEQRNLFLETDTLLDAREMVRRKREEGVRCPCCDQFCKVYHRQIHSTMASVLVHLFRIGKPNKHNEFHHVTKITETRTFIGDWAKLALWGLIEEMPKDETETKRRTSGFWRITSKGVDFVMKNLRVPRHLLIYNDTVIGCSDDLVDIEECLKKKFNYAELMDLK